MMMLHLLRRLLAEARTDDLALLETNPLAMLSFDGLLGGYMLAACVDAITELVSSCVVEGQLRNSGSNA